MPKRQKNLDLRTARHGDDGRYLDFVNEAPDEGVPRVQSGAGQSHECYDEAFKNRPLFSLERR